MPQHTTHAWFFFGDSLTQGVNDFRMPGGWVSRLAALGHESGLCPIPRATFYNLGARRHGTAEIAARWQREYACRLIPNMAPRIVFCLGVVDMAAPGGGKPKRPADVAEALRPVLDAAAALAPTLLISPPPVADAAACRRIADLCGLQAALCRERGILFAQVHDLLADDPDYMTDLSDGLHPGPRGCDRMAQTLLSQDCMRAFLRAA